MMWLSHLHAARRNDPQCGVEVNSDHEAFRSSPGLTNVKAKSCSAIRVSGAPS